MDFVCSRNEIIYSKKKKFKFQTKLTAIDTDYRTKVYGNISDERREISFAVKGRRFFFSLILEKKELALLSRIPSELFFLCFRTFIL